MRVFLDLAAIAFLAAVLVPWLVRAEPDGPAALEAVLRAERERRR